MPLELRKTSQWWYGRYNANGKVHCVNLRVPIEGQRPDSITQEGDKAFERSRGKALKEFEALAKQAKEKHQAEEYVQQLHEIRTGRRIDSIPLDKFADEWDKAARKRSGSPRYILQAHSLFKRFVEFVQKDYKDAESLADVTAAMAEAFMQGERVRGVSGRTFNAGLILLRSAFKVLTQKANIAQNPFAGILTADEETTHRKPFNEDELQAILKAADGDPFIRPVILTGICTAMRRGDCCLLRWDDVDLKERFVRVKTAKTGETVEIPLFAILCEEIKKQGRRESEYVFPEQAQMYLENAQGITYRVKGVLEAAGFFDEIVQQEPGEKKPEVVEDVRPLLPAGELLERGLKVLAQEPAGAMDATKRERMTAAFKEYVGGVGLPEIAAKMGVSKSSVSLYLHEMDRRTGLRVLRDSRKKRVAKRLGEVSAERKNGLRRASVRDFHSFRVTWITLALAAGVPMELVTRVTGHKTVDVVLKHYFRPGREDFRQAIEGAMPRLLMEPSVEAKSRIVSRQGAKLAKGNAEGIFDRINGGDRIRVEEAGVEYRMPPTPGELIRAGIECLEQMTAQNWKIKRDEAMKALREAQEWVDSHILFEKARPS